MRFAIPVGLICLFLALVIGCGGSGSSGTGNNPTTGSTSTTGGAMLTPAARGAILASAKSAYDSVPDLNGIKSGTALLTALQSIKGLTNLTIAPDGNVIGSFSDGVSMTFENNLPLRPRQVAGRTVQPRASTRLGTSGVQLLDSLDPILAQAIQTDDAASFRAHGYPGTTLTMATVEAYKALGSAPIGCLFMHGHGGNAFDPYEKQRVGFGIFSGTEAISVGPNANEETYMADLEDGSLGIGLAAYSQNDVTQVKSSRISYVVLPHLMSKYNWHFTSNAYVTLACCSGMSASAAPFRDSLYSAGASVIAGFTTSVYSNDDYRTNSYMFDRMLGANVVDPVQPPRRPFAWQEVLAALARLNQISFPATHGTTTFQVVPSSTWTETKGFTILNPSLSYIYIQEGKHGLNSNIQTGGSFGIPGAGAPTVHVGGQVYPLTPNKYNTEQAPITLPITGTVTVQLTGLGNATLSSNPRNLSGWSGNVTVTSTQLGQTSGSWTETTSIPVSFHSDLQSSYNAPDSTTPTYPNPEVSFGHNLYPSQSDLIHQLSVASAGTTVNEYIVNGMLQSTTTDKYDDSQQAYLDNMFNFVTLSVPPNPGYPAYFNVVVVTPNTMMGTQVLHIVNQPPQSSSFQFNALFNTSAFNHSADTWVPISIDSNYNVKGTNIQTQSNLTTFSVDFPAMSCSNPPVNSTPR